MPKKYDLDEERFQYAAKLFRTEDDEDIIKSLVKTYHMTEPSAMKLLNKVKRSKGLKVESSFEKYLESLNESLLEMSVKEAGLPSEVDGVDYNYSSHFFDRIGERGKITIDQLKSIMSNVRKKLKDLPIKGEFLFFSKSAKQGIVAVWDAIKSKLSFLTFLPPKEKPEDYFAKSGTEKVMIESKGNIQIIYID